MNKKQRILLALIIAFIPPGNVILANVLNELIGVNVFLMIRLSPILMAVGIYFLSFKIWDKTKQEASGDGRPRIGRFMNRRQRILFTSVITFVFPINVSLAKVLDGLTGEYLALWMLIPTSIIMAVGIHFLSFKIWAKTKQEAGRDGRPRTGGFMNRRQRILFTSVITFVFPVNLALAPVLDGLTGRYLQYWMMIPTSIIMAVGVYFLSFMIWEKAEA